MKVSVFLFAIVAYVAICYVSVRWFLALRGRIEGSKPTGFLRYTLAFVGAVLFLIPWLAFGMFFPAWLSESMEIVERTPNVTMGFILFGTAVIAVSTFLAGRRRRN